MRQTNKFGNILHWAVNANQPKTIEYILNFPNSEILINKKETLSITPLGLAVFNNNIECAKLLIKFTIAIISLKRKKKENPILRNAKKRNVFLIFLIFCNSDLLKTSSLVDSAFNSGEIHLIASFTSFIL